MCSARARSLIASLAALLLLLTAACGGDDGHDAALDAPAESSSDGEDEGSTGADEGDAPEGETDPGEEAEGDTAPVCELLTDAEIAGALGYDVVSKEADLMALPTCTWTLDVSSDEAMAMFPAVALTLMSEDDFRFRVDPGMDELYLPVDGLGDEAYMAFVPPLQENLAAMVQFYALDGDRGFSILPAVSTWQDAEAASADLVELGNLIFDRL